MRMGLKDALAASAENPHSTWPSRGAGDNRLEPECWPGLRPTFELPPGGTVFTIGSCFARNIETHLARLGFRVPALEFLEANPALTEGVGSEVLNKYTPAAIYQELAWVRGIMDRDDQVTDADVEPFLMMLPDGFVIDLQRKGGSRGGTPFELALRNRKLLFGLFREAFLSDSVVITLGLTECWWDRQTEQYVEFDKRFLRTPERFEFVRLEYPEAYDLVQQSVDLLVRDGPRPILLTTSPVPLSRTFTSDDVIIANTHSKSVLRAVAGVVAASNKTVDYFPSYESVMLTHNAEIWQNDLIHPESAFIGRIMARVTEAYTSSPMDAGLDDVLRLIPLARANKWPEASAVLARIGVDRLPDEHPEALGAALEILAHEGKRDAIALLLDRLSDQSHNLEADILLRTAGALSALRLDEEAARARETAFASIRTRPASMSKCLGALEREGQLDELEWVLRTAEDRLADKPEIMKPVAHCYARMNRWPDAERVWRRAAVEPHLRAEALASLATSLFKQQRTGEAVVVLEELEGFEPNHPALRRLGREYIRAGDRKKGRLLLSRLGVLSPQAPPL